MNKRKKTRKSSRVTKRQRQEITLDLFIVKCIREKKLKPWQHLEIATFMRSQGLRDKEDLHTYEETLRKY